MADAKISALPASTTPLVGTEVLPVVQSGATKQVSIANVTAGRAVSATSLALNGAASALTPAFIQNGEFSCSSFGADKQLATFGAYHNDLTNGGFVLSALVTDVVTEVARGGTAGLTVTSGNLVIGTAGKGIDFSADPSAGGMTSELLDDYEEGTFTPGIAFNNAAVDVTYSTQIGIYTKVGRCVTFSVRIILTSKGTSTGNMTVTGLPFTSAATYTYGASFAEWFDFNFGAINPIAAKINPSNTNISMYRNAAASYVQPITDVQVQNNTQFVLSGFYYV